jgi:arsenate reductase
MSLIQVISFADCPHAAGTLALVRDVAACLAPETEVQEVVAAGDAEAIRLGMRGSPTVLLDGRDLEHPAAPDPSFACRIYPEGSGVPPRWLIEAALLGTLRPRGIAFLCVANSARSPMAEGIARQVLPSGIAVTSAGSAPTCVNQLAVRAMAEVGIDISGHISQPAVLISPTRVDTVITLCSEEACSGWGGGVRRVAWPLRDPAAVVGDEETRLEAFRNVRSHLTRRISALARHAAG